MLLKKKVNVSIKDFLNIKVFFVMGKFCEECIYISHFFPCPLGINWSTSESLINCNSVNCKFNNLKQNFIFLKFVHVLFSKNILDFFYLSINAWMRCSFLLLKKNVKQILNIIRCGQSKRKNKDRHNFLGKAVLYVCYLKIFYTVKRNFFY